MIGDRCKSSIVDEKWTMMDEYHPLNENIYYGWNLSMMMLPMMLSMMLGDVICDNKKFVNI
jgi:hypothetical protein